MPPERVTPAPATLAAPSPWRIPLLKMILLCLNPMIQMLMRLGRSPAQFAAPILAGKHPLSPSLILLTVDDDILYLLLHFLHLVACLLSSCQFPNSMHVPLDGDDDGGAAETPGVSFQKGRIVGPNAGGWWTITDETGSIPFTPRNSDSESGITNELGLPHVPPSLPPVPVPLAVALSLLPSQLPSLPIPM